MRSPYVFGSVRVAWSLVFYIVSYILLFVCLSFSPLAMTLSVYFRSMSLTVPLVSFAPYTNKQILSNEFSFLFNLSIIVFM